MDITIQPKKLFGTLAAIPSKSQAHRLLICAAFADNKTNLYCPQINRDIQATADCLRSLGATIARTETGFEVIPAKQIPQTAVLNCCESGSTLRFFLPIVGALGIDATFLMEGRLPQRPLSPLREEMERMGCSLSRPSDSTIRCVGQLNPGDYAINGSVSSQFITGLLFALSLMSQPSKLQVTGQIESKPYIHMTKDAISRFEGHHSPEYVRVEGDWSNGAFWVAAQYLGSAINITGLEANSMQGDRIVVDLLEQLGNGPARIDARDIPDLVPILSVAAAANHGATFTNIGRLRLKESDRVASTIAMLEALGCKAMATEDTLTVLPCCFTGGTVDSMNDHRIAMSAAIAATIADGTVTILGAECVNKSYPTFWQEFSRLGGKL